MHDANSNDSDAAYEDTYIRGIRDADDDDTEAIGNAPPFEPTVMDLATGSESNLYEFCARSKARDLIKFNYAETACARLILRDGMVMGVDSDSRVFFDVLETDLDNLIWLTARRKETTNNGK